jgi:hypothetical protein
MVELPHPTQAELSDVLVVGHVVHDSSLQSPEPSWTGEISIPTKMVKDNTAI